jgi:prevent-host-death family protein
MLVSVATCGYIEAVKEETRQVIESLGLEDAPGVLRDAVAGTLSPSVTIRDAKTHLSVLLDWVSKGREVVITSDGRPKARLVPTSPEPPRKKFGGMGEFLRSQRVHGGATGDELVREDRDSRGW